MRHSIAIAAVATLALGFAAVLAPRAATAAEGAQAEAAAAAEGWLETIDAGDYAASWDAAAPLFQGAVDREKWTSTLESVRAPLGKLLSRTLKSAQYTKTLPGAPDGEYVVLQFDTSFENKKVAVETVTPMKAPDGSWRVSGYYIR
jgi:Protein of unknown function (DUF4019)